MHNPHLVAAHPEGQNDKHALQNGGRRINWLIKRSFERYSPFRELFGPESRLILATRTHVSKPDQELIAECLSGQTHAFGDLVARYQNRLFNTLVGVLGSVEDAHDVAQEAFVNAFQKLNTFRGHSAFYSWLFRIALNSAVSQKRKQRAVVSIDAAREQSGDDQRGELGAAPNEYEDVSRG